MKSSLGVSPVHKFPSALTFFIIIYGRIRKQGDEKKPVS